MATPPSNLTPQFNLDSIIRPNILALTPYRCARDDYDSGVLLDANENALGSSLAPVKPNSGPKSKIDGLDIDLDALSLHRYPSPLHIPLKENLCALRNVASVALPPSHDPSSSSLNGVEGLPPLTPQHTFLGVGSDEVIDLLFRVACRPGDSDGVGDRVLVCPPTYGMYSVTAQVNDVGVVKVNLDVEGGKFIPQLNKIEEVLSEAATGPRPIKLLFLTSPGNPTGTLIPLASIVHILRLPSFTGLLVIDEAYIDFSDPSSSAVPLVRSGRFPNLVVMQTLSKGFGLAGIRLGLAFADPALVRLLNNTKAPYTIGSPTAALALAATEPAALASTRDHVERLKRNRARLLEALPRLPGMGWPLGTNDANFVLIPVLSSSGTGEPDSRRAQKVYKTMAELAPDQGGGIVVRYRGNEVGCTGCLRITVGTDDECDRLLEVLPKVLAATP